ncbi:DNA alkylation repair protein [Pelagicoccus albus]|uniref:DNA alkylation repair protein n=1 Tax=Pelagicoccus albus TaxID=415222 RepID=A0A7X1E8Q1_9BACT|nr:DNA alkylation repair protein [Pelagicoccus albus]MBC2607010.1 DNA alkylation repair protein [Pelagicoccus albus]
MPKKSNAEAAPKSDAHNETSGPQPFKNLISPAVVRKLAELVREAYPDFKHRRFSKRCLEKLDSLELKARAQHIGEMLWEELPSEPETALDIVRRAIESLPTLEEDTSFDTWLFFPLNSLLSAHGTKSWKASMKLIPEVTKRFTAEFGIRVFLNTDHDRILPHLEKWAADPDPNLRRLVSEGTRSRLPWGEQIPAFKKDPSYVLPLLETLRDDPSEYVRRSVANNLNDISKDNPQVTLKIARRWLQDATPQRRRLVKHACRTLIKKGDAECLKLLGYGSPKIAIRHFSVSPESIQLGEKLKLSVELESTQSAEQQLIIDYRFHLVKASGSTAPKVFKGAIATLPGKSKKTVIKYFHLKPISTRRYYTGSNSVDLLINGKNLATVTFHLTVP